MAKRRMPDELMFLVNRNALQKTTDVSMKGKTCVVSGSTSGVGLAGVRRLARAGADIVLVCRNRDKAESVRKELVAQHDARVGMVLADFTDLSSVRRAADTLLEDYPRIDVLINSVGLHSTKRMVTRDGLETVFCVNHLGAFLLTRLLLERMKQSAPSRIIQVNSEGHRFGGLDLDDLDWKRRRYKGLKSYGASKVAQLLTVWEFADRLEGTGVTINAMHPGDVRTNIGNNNGWLYRWWLHNVTWHFLRDPSISGEALYYLAAAPEMADVSGRFFHLTIDEKPAKHALDRELGRKVWEASLKLTGPKTGP
ncbi:MAG: SDR family oxidoreductase [candidate division WOR-3 bacterium]|nr:MAG: SDR family oxidoreductase [candidate division WOR-3 bacterium]